MALLNLNKKTGDSLTAEEMNVIGRAIDDDTKAIEQINGLVNNGYTLYGVATPSTVPANKDKIFYFAIEDGTYKNFNSAVVKDGLALLIKDTGTNWKVVNLQAELHRKVEELMLGNSSHIASAWDYDSQSTNAVQTVGDTELLDLKPFLIDHTDNDKDYSTPVGVLKRNNYLRFEDGRFAPTVGITQAMADECKVALYRKVQGALTKYCDAGQFNPETFYNTYGINEKLFDVNGKEVRVLRPWETTETKYSIYTGVDHDVYMISNARGKSGKLWEAIFTQPQNWDGLRPMHITPTALTPSAVSAIFDQTTPKTRCFFCLYNGVSKNNIYSAGHLGHGNKCNMFVNNGTYPVVGGTFHQIGNMNLARANNKSAQSPVPFAEGGFAFRNLVITYLETKYGRKDFANTGFFESGISSNVSVNTNEKYERYGGVKFRLAGETGWRYRSFSVIESVVSPDSNGTKVYWSNILNNGGPKEQCMESQMAASWASEMRIPAGQTFQAFGNTYWWNNVPGALGLLDGKMNAIVYKRMSGTYDLFKPTGEPVKVEVEVILRMSLFEGFTLCGDIVRYHGGGYEVVATATATSGNGSIGEKVDVYIQPDQTKWVYSGTAYKDNLGKFEFESSYLHLGSSVTINNAVKRSIPYSNIGISTCGSWWQGDCYMQSDSCWWTAPGNANRRVRLAQRFGGHAIIAYCAPRYVSCTSAVSFAYLTSGGSAQVRLPQAAAGPLQG